ncbi:DUF2691 family protein [Bacillus pseudomycoides]|uniref:DUF2691 family protein n=1 Tax=Bacillus pseudomycoides TaxID=64104 RepID=UPI000BF12892|nr:DUF2691 family protein [Bacillus pseudomycoides]PEM67316.1 hypothetical protein CN619_25445 [Bacillus pseudomycoides]PGA60186.1 hypothetical protein COL84_23375 [Bacillus pseudomycoides]
MEEIGVFFKIPMERGNLRIESILELFIKIENYNWHIPENDCLVFTNNKYGDNNFLDNKQFETGGKLKEALMTTDFYPIFLNLGAYPHEIPTFEISNTSVNTILEFLNSKCSLMFVIIDCYEIAVFVKNIEDFPNVQQEILSQGYEDFRFIDKSANWRFS